MNPNPSRRLFVHSLAALCVSALVSLPLAAAEHEHAAATPTSAVAVLVPGANSNVSGIVHFTTESGGVHVHAEIKGLTPGSHGFHVHEKGDLSKADLTSAGGHFNPEGHHHADRSSAERHVGDLGNIDAGADGQATVDFVDPKLELSGPHSIIGRAVIIHAKADDLKSQPAGDAGARVAGGVIGITAVAK
jgi:Cu-Zn family superoxide dismutase